MSSLGTIITDEAQGKSDFVRVKELVGRMVDISLIPGPNIITLGRYEGTRRCSFSLKFQNISKLVREDDTTPDYQDYTHRWDYSEWMTRAGEEVAQGRPGIPERRGNFLGFVNKHLLEIGLDLNKPEDVERALRKIWHMEQVTWPRGYQVQKRDPDSTPPGLPVWYDSDGAETTEEPEGDADKVMIDAEFTELVPVSIEGYEFDEQEAYDRAKELRVEHMANDDFIAAAIDDPLIEQVPSLRRKIMSGKYDSSKAKG